MDCKYQLIQNRLAYLLLEKRCLFEDRWWIDCYSGENILKQAGACLNSFCADCWIRGREHPQNIQDKYSHSTWNRQMGGRRQHTQFDGIDGEIDNCISKSINDRRVARLRQWGSSNMRWRRNPWGWVCWEQFPENLNQERLRRTNLLPLSASRDWKTFARTRRTSRGCLRMFIRAKSRKTPNYCSTQEMLCCGVEGGILHRFLNMPT